MVKFLVGLTGKKFSGKSSAANYISEKYGFGIWSFADPLKKAILEIFEIDSKMVYGSEAEKNKIDLYWGVSGRQLMQVIGTDLFRDALPQILPKLNNIWIRRLERILKEFPDDICSIVVSDCRFADEAECVRDLGGIIIKIERSSSPDNDTHSSENQDVPADLIIENNGTLADLYKKIDDILSNYGVKKL